MNRSMSPRFHAATCASRTARTAAIILSSRAAVVLTRPCWALAMLSTLAVVASAATSTKKRLIVTRFLFCCRKDYARNILAYGIRFNSARSRVEVKFMLGERINRDGQDRQDKN